MTRLRQAALGATLALPCVAAAPATSSFIPAPSVPAITMQRQALIPTPNPNPGYTSAPTPNQDASAPQAKASNAPYVAPGFFTRTDQYRGEGLTPSSSAQAEQDRRAKPGAGFNLRMPIQ